MWPFRKKLTDADRLIGAMQTLAILLQKGVYTDFKAVITDQNHGYAPGVKALVLNYKVNGSERNYYIPYVPNQKEDK